MTTNIVLRLQAEMDPLLVERLTLFATGRCRRAFGPALGAPEDYVNQAILDTLNGDRHWREDIGLFQHLCGVISSLVSRDANRKENAAVSQVESGVAGTESPDTGPDPEEHLLATEAEARQRQLIERVRSDLQDDPPLQALAELILTHADPPPPRRLAEAIGCSVEIVYQMRRRLQRRLDWLMEAVDGP